MKLGSLDHPKIAELVILTGWPCYAVIGALESCWHQISRNHKQRSAITWPGNWVGCILGDDDAGSVFLAAMVAAGFLVPCDGGHMPGTWMLRLCGDGVIANQRAREIRLRELGEMPVAVRRDVLSAGVCAHCHATDDLTVDHIHPLVAGGTHDRNNLQCLCRSCNSRKRDRVEAPA